MLFPLCCGKLLSVVRRLLHKEVREGKAETESAAMALHTLQNPSGVTLLDASCKRILSIKGVLAWILKFCVPEFKDIEVKDNE